MRNKARRRVVFLCVAVAALTAAPVNRRPLNSSPFEHLTRAEQQSGNETEAVVELRSDTSKVCSGAPDYAKGVIPVPVPVPDPAEALKEPKFETDRRQDVLSLIRYPWEELGFSVVFMKSRAGYRAMTLTGKRRIEIYVREGEGPLHQAYDLAHELGHAFDLNFNTEERRREWRRLRGIDPSTPWFGCDACPDYGTPAGDFAETFAFLLLGPGNYHSYIAPMPKLDQIDELAAFCKIEHVAEAFKTRKAGQPLSASKKVREKRQLAREAEPVEQSVPGLIQKPEEVSPPEIQVQVMVPDAPLEVLRPQTDGLLPALNKGETLIPRVDTAK